MATGCDRREVRGCAVDHSTSDVNRNSIAHQRREVRADDHSHSRSRSRGVAAQGFVKTQYYDI
jgi:hypothetical protein